MLFKKLHIANSLVMVFLAILLSGPAFAGSGAPSAGTTKSSLVVPARRPPPSQPPITTEPTKTDEAGRYAAREIKAKGLETFVGGDRGIYIGSSVLVVALLVVLILVLI